MTTTVATTAITTSQFIHSETGIYVWFQVGTNRITFYLDEGETTKQSLTSITSLLVKGWYQYMTILFLIMVPTLINNLLDHKYDVDGDVSINYDIDIDDDEEIDYGKCF